MCGITGWLAPPGRTPDHGVLAAVTRALAHRGPDAEGVVIDGVCGLGHRRLSVLDLSHANDQPQRDATGRWLLAYNGEIYNFRALRAELQALGHVFRTQGDTEVLIEAVKAWGPRAVERFVGMFAFALWDTQSRQLLLARDRLGKKPLFVAELADGGGIVFASEPRALAAHPAIGRRIDPVMLAHYLQLNYVPNHGSLFTGVRSLPPGTWAQLAPGGRLEPRPYWDLATCFRDKRRYRSDDEAAEALNALVDEAVNDRLVSDVPLGAFLSGGVDSSAIVASMVRQRPASEVLTFTSGFVEDSYDESPIAERLAGQFGVVHRTQRLDTRTLDILPAVLATGAEPLADTSALPMHFLSAFTRQHVTVALSGDGGDECFAGYETYVADRLHRMASHSPRWLRQQLPALLERWLPVDHRKIGWPEKVRRLAGQLAATPDRAHAAWRDIFDAAELRTLMQPQWRAAVDAAPQRELFESYFEPHFAAVEGCDPLDQATYVDIKTWMVDDILVKADRASMAHSLEVRCPLLDHRIVEFAARLPPELKLRGFKKKHVLRHAQRARLPDWLLHRKKQGFNAPVSQWLLGPLRELTQQVLLSPRMTEWFQAQALQRLWDEHAQMRRDNGLKLFGLLTVGLFLGAG
jgi:asparagine synthase (glutamine-hydrolysing)